MADRRLSEERFAELLLREFDETDCLADRAAAVRAQRAAGVKRTYQLSKRYEVNANREWLIAYVCADGLVTLHTSFGVFGHVWHFHGRETILHFLVEMQDMDYVAGKFSNGRTEYDDAKTYRAIKQYILDSRQNGHFDKDEARAEWKILHQYSYDGRLTEGEKQHWYEETDIGDAAEMFRYVYPSDVRNMLERLWPAFIEAVKKDIL
jgi:hypothetical protein